jgi:serine/threonine-protein kinase
VDVRYLPGGYLLFLRRGTLFAVRFDAARVEIQGEAVAVLDGIAQTSPSGPGQFAVSPTGTLAWIPGQLAPPRDAALVAVDRKGHVVPLPAPHRSYGSAIRPSPDGRRLAVTVRSLTDVGVWIYDVGRGTLTPLAGDAEVMWPLWSLDGQRLWISWLKDGRTSLAALPADGGSSPQAFLAGEFSPSSWAPDQQHLAAVPASGLSGGDIFIVSLENGRVGVRPWLETPHTEWWPAFSPDGRWLAYGSNMSGRYEVYVRPYPGPGPAEQVSIDGGQSPAWSPDGTQLYFVGPSNPEGLASMMVVDLDAGSALRVGRPRALFRFDPAKLQLACAPVRCYDLAPDGQGFYAVQPVESPPPPVVTHINLIENWFEELKTKVRVR